MIYQDLYVDGHPLSQFASCITEISGLHTSAITRGDNVVIPGKNGEIWVEKPYATNQIDLGISLYGITESDFNTNHRTMQQILIPGKRLNLERHLSYNTGNEIHYAHGELAGALNPTISLLRFGRMTMSLKVLEGVWYSGIDTTDVLATSADLVNGNIFKDVTVTSTGTARTVRAIIHIPKNTLNNTTNFVTITNNTTNTSFTVFAINNSADIDFDVENLTTDGMNNNSFNYIGNSSTSNSTYFHWTTLYPFSLMPGDNSIHIETQGYNPGSDSIRVIYKEAYQ